MKYMGSKERIAKFIVPILQNKIDEKGISTYIEPFCGSCAIIEKIIAKNRLASDRNEYLIALLKYVQKGGDLPNEVSRELYNDVRNAYRNKDFSKYSMEMQGIVGFLASYNGRFFDGGYARAGHEKTKNGEVYRDYYSESKRNIEAQREKLQGIEFKSCEYQEVLNNLSGNETCVVYIDPPYKDTKGFVTSKNFNYNDFWSIIRKVSKEHFVFISEESAPDDFEIVWQKETLRSIKSTDKSTSVERLFVFKNGLT